MAYWRIVVAINASLCALTFVSQGTYRLNCINKKTDWSKPHMQADDAPIAFLYFQRSIGTLEDPIFTLFFLRQTLFAVKYCNWLIDPVCTKQPSSWRSLTCGWWREVEGTRRKKFWPKSGATKKRSTLNWSPSWTTSRRGRGWHSPCQSSPSSRLLPTTLPQVGPYFYLHFDSHFIWGLPMWFYLKLGFLAFFWDFTQKLGFQPKYLDFSRLWASEIPIKAPWNT